MILQQRCPAAVMLTRLVDSYRTFNSAGVKVVWFCYASCALTAFLMFFMCIMCTGFVYLPDAFNPHGPNFRDHRYFPFYSSLF